MGELDGRVALVTGGARGQGAAEARLFAREGATVVITDVLDEQGEQTAGAIGCEYHHLDVSSEAEWQAVVDDTVARHGRIDVLMNNAGIFRPAQLVNTTTEMWNLTLAINQTGVFLGMRTVSKAMIALEHGGSIINTSSIEAMVAEPMAAPYNTAKAGLINLTRTVAVEYGRKRIRANCICPGVVETPLFEMLAQIAPKSREEIAAEHALGRLLHPDEIANVALFLASDESSAITGAALVVDGGLTCRSPISGFPPYGG